MKAKSTNTKRPKATATLPLASPDPQVVRTANRPSYGVVAPVWPGIAVDPYVLAHRRVANPSASGAALGWPGD